MSTSFPVSRLTVTWAGVAPTDFASMSTPGSALVNRFVDEVSRKLPFPSGPLPTRTSASWASFLRTTSARSAAISGLSSEDRCPNCGVKIAHDKGLVGHSDADAGWHALVDAILGALGEGDIGAHFPPSDATWKAADSETFLRHAHGLLGKAQAQLTHVDVTIMCEAPRVSPYREAMRARTAEVLGLPLSAVSVKATTTERMGFLGREEGLAAIATATVSKFLQE